MHGPNGNVLDPKPAALSESADRAFPSRCPRCDTNWAKRDIGSPIRTQRTGFQKMAQILSDVLLREVGNENASTRKLVVFSDIRRKHSRIEIIPLIDIMFFLLASFMMVSLQLNRTQNIQVNLPSAICARPDFKPDMVNIAVDKAGGIWLEKKPLTLPELSLVLSNRFRLDTNLPVYISGDRDTLHGTMVDVLETVRRAGVQKVVFTVGGNEDQPATNTP
jgi:biopolymer transport protein ExbD